MGFLQKIKLNCQTYPNRRIYFDQQQITYAELWSTATQVRIYLQNQGLNSGESLALQLPKSLEFLYFHLACLQLGAVTIPLNPAFTPNEIQYYLMDSAAKIFVTTSEQAQAIQGSIADLPNLKEILCIDPQPSPGDALAGLKGIPCTDPFSEEKQPPKASAESDIALIIYTSGTTGRAKGAMLSQENILTNLESLHQIWGHSSEDILLHCLPIFHVHGLLFAFHGALHAGMEIVMRSKFDPLDTLTCIKKYQCTVFMGVPTLYYRLLQVNDQNTRIDLPSMRLWVSGSAPLATATFTAFQKQFQQSILERYGMSETGIIASNPLTGERKPGSVGFSLPGVELRIVQTNGLDASPGEIGEVWLRGKNVFCGYWQMPEKTAASFSEKWFKTGDLGYQDAEGYLFLVGRSKDLIISGGMNIYPKEIESLLETLPQIAETAVVGVPDPDFGEKTIAIVVLHPGASLDKSVLKRLCQAKLADYKRPKNFYWTDHLPKNAMGKVMKNLLRTQYTQN